MNLTFSAGFVYRFPRSVPGRELVLPPAFLVLKSYSRIYKAPPLHSDLDGPDFSTSIPTTGNKVFVDEPHLLRRLRVPINNHTRMRMCRSIVIFNPILAGTSNDFT